MEDLMAKSAKKPALAQSQRPLAAAKTLTADSDEVARAFRDDAAHGFRHDVVQGACLAGC
jgi:hypothetical protein